MCVSDVKKLVESGSIDFIFFLVHLADDTLAWHYFMGDEETFIKSLDSLSDNYVIRAVVQRNALFVGHSALKLDDIYHKSAGNKSVKSYLM